MGASEFRRRFGVCHCTTACAPWGFSRNFATPHSGNKKLDSRFSATWGPLLSCLLWLAGAVDRIKGSKPQSFGRGFGTGGFVPGFPPGSTPQLPPLTVGCLTTSGRSSGRTCPAVANVEWVREVPFARAMPQRYHTAAIQHPPARRLLRSLLEWSKTLRLRLHKQAVAGACQTLGRPCRHMYRFPR